MLEMVKPPLQRLLQLLLQLLLLLLLLLQVLLLLLLLLLLREVVAVPAQATAMHRHPWRTWHRTTVGVRSGCMPQADHIPRTRLASTPLTSSWQRWRSGSAAPKGVGPLRPKQHPQFPPQIFSHTH